MEKVQFSFSYNITTFKKFINIFCFSYCDEQFVKAEMAEAINMSPAEFDEVATRLLQVIMRIPLKCLLSTENPPLPLFKVNKRKREGGRFQVRLY